jgi:DNA-binding transcriptional MocR family regulator
LHLVVLLDEAADERAVLLAARARGLAVSPLAAYFCGPARMKGLVIGFATTPAAMAADAARRLAGAVRLNG